MVEDIKWEFTFKFFLQSMNKRKGREYGLLAITLLLNSIEIFIVT